MSEGRTKKLLGMDQALRKYALWKEDFAEAAREYAESGIPFTAEDVLDVVGLPSGKPGQNKNNAVGAMMYGLARRGLIKKTGKHVQARRTDSHAREMSQWIGVEHDDHEEEKTGMWVYEMVEYGVKDYYRVGYVVGKTLVWVERYDTLYEARDAVNYLNGGHE